MDRNRLVPLSPTALQTTPYFPHEPTTPQLYYTPVHLPVQTTGHHVNLQPHYSPTATLQQSSNTEQNSPFKRFFPAEGTVVNDSSTLGLKSRLLSTTLEAIFLHIHQDREKKHLNYLSSSPLPLFD